jgi:two-component system OmpR family response regulator
MKVLLIEDDRLLAREIAKALREENCAVDVAANGEDGQHLGNSEAYDVAVLDLGLPKVPGVQVLRAWRKNGRQLPVLILTARDGWTEKVDGFKAGADDYLTKPFRIEELVMRLRALVRRSAGHAAPSTVCEAPVLSGPDRRFRIERPADQADSPGMASARMPDPAQRHGR